MPQRSRVERDQPCQRRSVGEFPRIGPQRHEFLTHRLELRRGQEAGQNQIAVAVERGPLRHRQQGDEAGATPRAKAQREALPRDVQPAAVQARMAQDRVAAEALRAGEQGKRMQRQQEGPQHPVQDATRRQQSRSLPCLPVAIPPGRHASGDEAFGAHPLLLNGPSRIGVAAAVLAR
jgi:hypothetical protein